jgi:hypothetical protein
MVRWAAMLAHVPATEALLRGAALVKQRVAPATPALRLLQRRQLLWLAKKAAGTTLLGPLSLEVSHNVKLPTNAVPRSDEAG